MTDPENRQFEACAHCEEPFRQDVSYPVVAQQEDGELSLYSFCDEECRAAWAAEN